MSDRINAILTNQGVNYGDHAENRHMAIAVDPAETVGDLLARTCVKRHWSADLREETFVPDGAAYLTLRLATEAQL